MRALVCVVLAACSFERPADVTFGSAAITVVSGDDQEGITGSPLAMPFEVNVVDDDLLPIANFTVEFAVTDGEGTLSEARVRTDAQGNAITVLTLGRRVGENTVDVTGEGISTERIFFSALGRVGAPAKLVVVSGDGESAVVDTELAPPLVARLEDANENPIEGMPIDFAVTSGGGSVSVGAATTNVDGVVETRLTPGTTAGLNTVEARVPGIEPAVFTVTGLADVAFSISKVDGDAQLVTALLPADPFSVVVRDQHGNPVAGTAVAWSVTGTGALSAASSSTDADGRAETVLTAASMVGNNTVQATAAGLVGSPVSFVATTRTFRPSVNIPFSANNTNVARASAVADLDGDDRPDLIVVRGPSAATRFEVALNRTEPMATTPAFLASVSFGVTGTSTDDLTSLSAVDLDGDGKLDIVATGGNKLVYLLNKSTIGNLSFASPISTSNGLGSTQYRDHVMVDFNGDDVLDALIDVDTNPLSTVFRRNTSLTSPNFAGDAVLTQMRGPLFASDLDGDQQIDLVGRNGNVLRVCRNNATACTLTTVSFGALAEFTVFDVDGDGKPDLVTTSATAGNGFISVTRNTTAATLSFAAPTSTTTSLTPSSIRGADINGDGRIDIVGRSGTGQVIVHFNTTTNGVPTFGGASSFPDSVDTVHAVDLNGDQHLDVVAVSSISVFVRLQQ